MCWTWDNEVMVRPDLWSSLPYFAAMVLDKPTRCLPPGSTFVTRLLGVIYESWAKGPWKGFPLRKPLGMQLTVSAKVFSETAKENFFLAKVLAKVHVHMSKLHCRYLYLVFIMYILYVSFCKNYWGIFRESLAKVLLKPWRKTTFIWRLGGLNCGLVVSELTNEGEQGPTS